MQAARQLGAGGIGAYNNGSVNIDLGPSREWDGAVGVPGLAEGARVSKPTLALIGEGGEPEYVVPQSKAIKFAHEMISAQPRYKTKKHTHYVIVPILS
jgi:SLT domain-containing protein